VKQHQILSAVKGTVVNSSRNSSLLLFSSGHGSAAIEFDK